MMQEAGQTQGQRRPEAEAGGLEVRGQLCGGGRSRGYRQRQTGQGVILQEERQWPGQESQSEGHQGKQRYKTFGFDCRPRDGKQERLLR